MLRSAVFALCALVTLGSAQAAAVVDQSALVSTAPRYRGATTGAISGPFGVTYNGLVQTVTAGISGRLDAIDVQLLKLPGSSSGYASFVLYDGTGLPNAVQFAFSTGIEVDGLPTQFDPAVLTRFDVSSANFVVSPGQVFSFAIQAFEPGVRVAVLTGSGPADRLPPLNQYAGGQLSQIVNFNLVFDAGGDAGFRTLVSPLAAPEPASWSLMIAGMAVVGIALRRRDMITT